MLTATAPTARRLEILDLARGVGFLLVLFRHCLGFLGGTLLAHVMPQDATILDFFFLLSGFFAGYAYEQKLRTRQKTVLQSILERIVRVYPMVILGTLIGALPFILRMILRSDVPDTLSILASLAKGSLLIPTHAAAFNPRGSLALFPLDVPLWFLFFDCLAYLLFLFILRFLPLPVLIAVAFISAFGLWTAAISHNGVSFGASWEDLPFSLPRSLFGFTFGYILFRCYRPTLVHIGGVLAIAPIIALLAVIFIPVSASWRYSGELQAFIAIVVMPAIIILGMYSQAGARVTVLARLAGRLSLAVYALHFPIVMALSSLRWSFHLQGAPGLALLAAEFLLPLVIAFYATVYIDEPIRVFLLKKVGVRSVQQSTFLSPANG